MNKNLLIAGGSILSFTAGAVAGYFFAKKRLEAEYLDLATKMAEDELDATKEWAKQKYATAEDAAKALIGYQPPTSEPTDGQLRQIVDVLKKDVFEQRNIFAGRRAAAADEAERSKDRPYILDRGEFMESENYSQITLVYYEQDQTLADEDDDIVDDVEEMVGEAVLNNFGYRSEDPNVVYVRNERLGTEYEIIRNEGSYREIVAGLD